MFNPQLWWCHEGNALITAADATLTARAGDLVIAPTGAIVRPSPDGVILPLSFPDCPLTGATRIMTLGPAWSDRLVGEYARCQLGYQALSEDIRSISDGGSTPLPPLPRHHIARAIAHDIMADPAAATSLLDFAGTYGVSDRTIQRHFLHDTGLSFSGWRSAYRVHLAAGMLGRGTHRIADASRAVGFGAASSLTRAFRRHTGTTPAAFVAGPPVAPQRSGALTVFAHPDGDQVLWMYKGTATVTTPGYCRFLTTGEVVTVPAGTHTRLDIAAGSIAIPVPLYFDETQHGLRHACHTSDQPFRALTPGELSRAAADLIPTRGN